MMPFLDGLEVTRRLRRERIRVPIVLLTARDAPEEVVRGLRHQVHAARRHHRVTGRQDATHITIAVADTGAGIAAEDQSWIFERFWRAD